jgi:hypothetical protein
LKGKATDAHNSISIAVDGEGYLHMAWDHHNNSLHYVKSIAPFSLEFSKEMSMTQLNESRLTYPEFYNLPGGDLLFLYRDGQSGKGNLVVNRYDVKNKAWTQLQHNLVDGEGKRNAYWQAFVDVRGVIHLSWVWRETPDVASNHDLCYAKSIDGGKTWLRSDGATYSLPINAQTAEVACVVPQGSDLINQTSMTTDDLGQPLIATYWRDSDSAVPQYHVVALSARGWKSYNVGFCKTAFSLSGGGTKRIPISRPQIIAWTHKSKTAVVLLFRDTERRSKVSIAVTNDIETNRWKLKDLTAFSVGSWEPTSDPNLWLREKKIHLFVQHTEQADSEGQLQMKPQIICVLEWNPQLVQK